jgi:hypothetical protein
MYIIIEDNITSIEDLPRYERNIESLEHVGDNLAGHSMRYSVNLELDILVALPCS